MRTDRRDGIGDWFLGTREFREWRSNEGGAEKAVCILLQESRGGEDTSKVSASFIRRNRNYR